jgi:hypothetical protein
VRMAGRQMAAWSGLERRAASGSLGEAAGLGRLGLEYRPGLRNNANPRLECGRSSGVEHNLAKVRVARSNRVARSKFQKQSHILRTALSGRFAAYTTAYSHKCTLLVSNRKRGVGYGGGLWRGQRDDMRNPYGDFESHSLRHSYRVELSPRLFRGSKIPSICAGFLPKLRTDSTASEADFVSLRPVVSKAPDCGQTVRIFKWLICQRYFALEIRAFRIPLGAREELASNRGLKSLGIRTERRAMFGPTFIPKPLTKHEPGRPRLPR